MFTRSKFTLSFLVNILLVFDIYRKKQEGKLSRNKAVSVIPINWFLESLDIIKYTIRRRIKQGYVTYIGKWTAKGIKQQSVGDENKNNILFRGSAFYYTTPKGRLAFLNNIMTVFKSEVDNAGNILNKEWE